MSRYVDEKEAKYKSEVLKKFKEEQFTKIGGSRSSLFACMMGAGLYFGSHRYGGVEKIPYRLMLATLGYGAGVNLGTYIFGDKNHNVYYTQEEYKVLVDHLGPSWVNRIKVIKEEDEEGSDSKE